MTYNEGLSNDLFNQIIPNQNLPTSYTNVSSLNQFNFNSFPKTDYTQAKEIFYSVTPLTSNNVQKNYSNQTNYNNYIIQGFNNDLIQTDYGPTRNTFTVPLNSSIIPKILIIIVILMALIRKFKQLKIKIIMEKMPTMI